MMTALLSVAMLQCVPHQLLDAPFRSLSELERRAAENETLTVYRVMSKAVEKQEKCKNTIFYISKIKGKHVDLVSIAISRVTASKSCYTEAYIRSSAAYFHDE